MDLLDQFGSPLPPAAPPMMPTLPPSTLPQSDGLDFPAVIIPREFSLATQDQTNIDKIRDEVMDKVHAWQGAQTQFVGEYEEFARSWRVQPRDVVKRPKGLFNSKSGETHRAVETLATLWFRMGTASDNYFEAVECGFDPMGQPLTQSDLFAIEKLIMTQLRNLKFKENLLVALRSLALFGTVIVEENWIRRMNLDGKGYFEGTSFEPRSLLNTGFDTTVTDLDFSDFIFTVDYPTTWKLKQWARNSPDVWDKSIVEQELADTQYNKNSHSVRNSTDVWNRIIERKQRAGYTATDFNVREIINYHGRLDTDNPLIREYWDWMGYQDEPDDCDFTTAILSGDVVPKFHVTQYKTWHSKFKTAAFKRFELEPLGYGVGKIGKKAQREIDVTFSRSNDALTMNLWGIWKLGRFAGLAPNQFQIKPHQIVTLEDVNQLEQVKMDINSIVQALAMIANSKDDLRTTVGAPAGLQAQVTRATATEASLTQTEGIRGGSVHAEILFETLMRDHLQQVHINNLDNLDESIWVSVTGEPRPRFLNKNNLPANVGFEIRITTDKNFRPERIQKIMEALNLGTHANNFLPPGINFVQPLMEELFKALDVNPRLLSQQITPMEQAVQMIKLNSQMGGQGMAGKFSKSPEAAGENSQTTISTPVGQVPTSPLGPMPEQSAA